MSKRKTALKQARSPKIAAKAQRAAQAIVRSPKVALRSVSKDSAKTSSTRQQESKLMAPLAIEQPVAAREEKRTGDYG